MWNSSDPKKFFGKFYEETKNMSPDKRAEALGKNEEERDWRNME